MQKIKAFFLTLTTSLLLIIVWGTFLLTKTLSVPSKNELYAFVPSNASFSIRVDGKKMIKELMLSIISTEDENNITQLNQLIKEERGDFEDIGINFNEEFILSSIDIANDDYLCLYVHVSRPSQFIKKSINWPNSGAAVKDHIGVILLDTHNSKKDREALNIQAAKLLERTHEIAPAITSDIHIELGKGVKKINSIFMPGSFDIYIDNNEIRYSGAIEYMNESPFLDGKKLKCSGLQFNLPTIAPELADSIIAIQEEFGLENYSIEAVSLNYKGLTIEEIPGLKLQPDIDLLVRFSEETSLDSLLGDILKQNDQFEMIKGGFRYGDVNYYAKQLDGSTIYLGRTPYSDDIIEDQDEDILFAVEGDMSRLTFLGGNGMMKKFVELLSVYAATKAFVNRTEHFDMILKKGVGNNAALTGHLQFKSAEAANLAVIHFLLNSKLIK